MKTIVTCLAVFISITAWCGPSLAASAPPRGVVVGVYENAPKIYMDEHGKPAGFFIELLQEIAQREHWNLKYTACTWDDCLKQLGDGRIDLMPDVVYSEERGKLFDFHTISVVSSWSQIHSNPLLSIQTLNDLAGLRVAVLKGSIQQTFLEQLGPGYGIEFTLIQTNSLPEAFDAVHQGKADAVISNNFFSARNASIHDLRETPLLFQPLRLFYAAKKGRNGDLLLRIDDYLARWRQDPDSVYFQIMKRAMVPPQELAIPRWISWTVAAVSGLALLLLATVMLLRWQVREQTASLQQTSERLDRVLASSPVVLYALRKEGDRFVPEWSSANLGPMFGFSLKELRAPDWWPQHIHPEDRETALLRFQALPQAGHLTHEYRIFDAQGRIRHIRDELQFNPGKPGESATITGSWSDQTESRASANQISFLTYHDALTGLPNRLLLHDRLTHALDRAKRDGSHVALINMDFDRFKNINDTLGHPVGDAMLKHAAERLTGILPAGETLARWGGDEFIILLEKNANLHEVSSLANQLKASFAEPMNFDGHELTITSSLGISLFPEDGDDPDTLLKNAELALYKAKKKGRNTVSFFSADLSEGTLDRLHMENQLRGACSRNELLLHYQPQFNLSSSELIGVEALVRWQHPELGMVSPAKFIPLAEETGLIEEIGLWVLHEACRQMVEWQSAGLKIPRVSVNLSVQQIEKDTLLAQVTQVLAESGLDAARLELEVTESTIMNEPDKAASALHELKALGVQLAIDDFGTGHSSLSYLKRLPLDRLKIDQSFVRDIGKDANDETISRAIISMARSLRLETVAEGIEKEEHAEFLRREGCNHGQGYLFSRPVPAGQITENFSV